MWLGCHPANTKPYHHLKMTSLNNRSQWHRCHGKDQDNSEDKQCPDKQWSHLPLWHCKPLSCATRLWSSNERRQLQATFWAKILRQFSHWGEQRVFRGTQIGLEKWLDMSEATDRSSVKMFYFGTLRHSWCREQCKAHVYTDVKTLKLSLNTGVWLECRVNPLVDVIININWLHMRASYGG